LSPDVKFYGKIHQIRYSQLDKGPILLTGGEGKGEKGREGRAGKEAKGREVRRVEGRENKGRGGNGRYRREGRGRECLATFTDLPPPPCIQSKSEGGSALPVLMSPILYGVFTATLHCLAYKRNYI